MSVNAYPLISGEDAIAVQGEDTIFFDGSFHLPNTGRDAEAEFIENRIKGAKRFDINAIALPDAEQPHTMPTAPLFQRHMQMMGINQTSHIIIYDNSPVFSSARVWFMFRYFGFGNVQVLNGGLKAWVAAGGKTTFGALTDDEDDIKRGDFQAADPIDNDGMLSVHALKRMVNKPVLERSRNILDARSEERFYGQAPEPRPGLASGHMPGAINIPFNKLIDPETKMMRSKEELEAVFADIDSDKKIVTTCGSGVTACVLILGLNLIGRHDAALYDGSWSEWGSREDCPISV